MDHITLNDEQLHVVAQARQPIAVREEQGQLCGCIAVVVSQAELADAKRVLAVGEPRYTTDEVMAALRARGTP
jgi:hypothetical protein